MNRKLAVLTLILLGIALLLPASANASGAPAWLRPGPGAAINAAQTGDDPDVFIVVFQAPPLAAYQGDVPGLAATNPEALGETMLDPASPAS
jgi:hypothetical protein